MDKGLYRFHYRANVRKDISQQDFEAALKECETIIKDKMKDEHIMTAALYHYNRMLFFYYEADNEECKPETMVLPISDYLEKWPSEDGFRTWVYMYHIFCHAYPVNWEDWKRKGKPELRRGRITRLKKDKLFSYVYYHKALVDEGLLTGDRYQSIALHENILFSYFEEPKTITNVKGDLDKSSQVIKEWLAVNPEAHFDRLPEADENFLFIPAYFALGQGDI